MPTSNNLSIIVDEAELDSFLSLLPPTVSEESCYFLSLFARKKYIEDESLKKHFPSNSNQIKRDTAGKERIKDRLRTWEHDINYYKIKDVIAPPNCLVAYINPNPRDLKKALKNFVTEAIGKVFSDSPNGNIIRNLYTTIQSARGSTHFYDFEYDGVEENELLDNLASINLYNYHVVKTRGGFHVLIEGINDSMYKSLSKIKGFDKGEGTDKLCPIPGCIQGGFVTKLVVKNSLKV